MVLVMLLVSLLFCRCFAERNCVAEVMATDSDSEFLDAAQTTMSDVSDAQLVQLQEHLVATMIENDNISWSSHFL